MTISPTLTGRDIALAHNATRAVLETVLTEFGVTFRQSVQLNVIADNDGNVVREELVRRLVDGLKISVSDANDEVTSLIDAGLASTTAETIEPTEYGAATHAKVQAATAQIVATLYGGLPTEDLVVTQRILAALTERANRELELTTHS